METAILRKELASINDEALKLDAEIMSLLDGETSEHDSAIAAAQDFFSATGLEDSSGSGSSATSNALVSKDALQNLVEPAQFEAIATEAFVLAEQIEDSRLLAERVSRTVRQLDEAQMNVQQALALVEDVVNLKGCAQGVVAALKEDDLVGATGYVRQFHDIASVAAKASDDYERMVEAEAELQKRVLGCFADATTAGDASEVAKQCALLGPLGLAKEGVEGYLKFAKTALAAVTDEAAATGAALSVSTSNYKDPVARSDACNTVLAVLFNGAAAFLQQHAAVCAAALSRADGGARLLQLVHADIETAASQALAAYVSDMGLAKHVETASKQESQSSQSSSSFGPMSGASSSSSTGDEASDGRRFTPQSLSLAAISGGSSGNNSNISGDVAGYGGGIEELNGVLEAIALVVQGVESYDRFIRHQALELEEQSSSDEVALQQGLANAAAAGPAAGPSAGRRVVLPPQTKLNESLAELGAYYAQLERASMVASVRKALALDALPPAATHRVNARASRAARDALTAARAAGSGAAGKAANLATGLLAAVSTTSSSTSSSSSSSSSGGGNSMTALTSLGNESSTVISSTAVEDAFFVAQGSAMRAVATGHPQSCAATFNHVVSILSEDLLEPLVKAAQAAAQSLGKGADGGDPALASALGLVTQSLSGVAAGVADGASRYNPLSRISGGIGMGGSGGNNNNNNSSSSGGGDVDDEDAADLAVLENAARKAGTSRAKDLIALNNLEASSTCAKKLADLLLAEVQGGFELGPSQQQLQAVVQDLASVADRFSAARDDAISTLAAALRPKLRSAVTELLGGESATDRFVMTESSYATAESLREEGGDWATALLDKVSATLEPLCGDVGLLSHGNAVALLVSVAEFLAKRLETSLRKHAFTALGAMSLDKDIRRAVAWFAQRAGRNAVRSGPFLRLSQVVLLVNSEELSDVPEAWMEGFACGGEWQLTADEVRKVLALRTDFDRAAIDKLTLN